MTSGSLPSPLSTSQRPRLCAASALPHPGGAAFDHVAPSTSQRARRPPSRRGQLPLRPAHCAPLLGTFDASLDVFLVLAHDGSLLAVTVFGLAKSFFTFRCISASSVRRCRIRPRSAFAPRARSSPPKAAASRQPPSRPPRRPPPPTSTSQCARRPSTPASTFFSSSRMTSRSSLSTSQRLDLVLHQRFLSPAVTPSTT
ncbi:hypothetical protein C8R46DRAFT_289459 [Mycena filopes]|nr:hypothetical protein C8R46DRAFT_289459 [Mycena filopes]